MHFVVKLLQQKKLYELEKQVKFANSLHQAMVVKNNALTGCNLELEGKVKLLTGQLNNLVNFRKCYNCLFVRNCRSLV